MFFFSVKFDKNGGCQQKQGRPLRKSLSQNLKCNDQRWTFKYTMY